MNKEHIEQLAKDFAGDYDCMNNNDAIFFAIKFLEHLIEKGEVVVPSGIQKFLNDSLDKIEEAKQATPAKVISDEEIKALAMLHLAGACECTYEQLCEYIDDPNDVLKLKFALEGIEIMGAYIRKQLTGK